jgi:hypothetical protein
LDHDDVIWDNSKGQSSGEQEREEKIQHKVLVKNRKS